MRNFVLRYNSDGTLDPGFTGGTSIRDSYNVSGIHSVACLPDDRVVVACSFVDDRWGLICLDPDGSLCGRFASNGIASIGNLGIPEGTDYGKRVLSAIDVRGEAIYVAGGTMRPPPHQYPVPYLSLIWVAKLDLLGQPVSGYGTFHHHYSDYLWPAKFVDINDCIADRLNRLVLVGTFKGDYWSDHACITVFDANGRADGDFGFSGRHVADLPGLLNGSQSLSRVTIDSLNRIVTVGTAAQNTDGTKQIAIVRRFPSSNRDASFAGEGYVLNTVGPSAVTVVGASVMLHGRDDILACFTSGVPAGGHFDSRIVKYTSAGELDTSWGDDGVAQSRLSDDYNVEFTDLYATRERIFVVGAAVPHSAPHTRSSVCIHCFDHVGRLVENFGDGGVVLTDAPGLERSRANSIDMDSQRRIVLSGTAG